MKNTNNLKVQKEKFEVEGIEGLFEGVHIGERYSYGVVPYFTKDICLNIISKCEHTLTINFNNNLDLFEESFEEEGEILINFSPKLEIFGITYYHIGNGWSWEIDKQYEAIKRNIDGTILKVIKQRDYDRCVFITYLNEEIVGLNFHQDASNVLYEFATPCIHLTEIFNRLTKCKLSSNKLSQDDSIDKAIDLYVEAFIFQD